MSWISIFLLKQEQESNFGVEVEPESKISDSDHLWFPARKKFLNLVINASCC